MKRLSMIFLLGCAFTAAFSQNMYLKKITVQLDPFSNNYYYYSYDENMHLQTIHAVNAWGDTVVTKEFEDERLVLQYGPGLTYQLEYTADTVYEYRLQPDETFALSFVYVINSMHQVTRSIVVDPSNGNYLASQDYAWSAGNCTGATQGGSTVGSFTYDADVLNPMFNENKYFRRGSAGSLNQYVHTEYYGQQSEMTIISTLNGYPTEILYNPSNGNELTLLYEYIETSGIAQPAITGNYTVLDRKYYTLAGQEISKPSKGLYIERLFTNRGVVSHKRYVIPR